MINTSFRRLSFCSGYSSIKNYKNYSMQSTPIHQETKNFVKTSFDESITNTLIEYIKIPNTSPSFDSDGLNTENTRQVIKLFSKWIEDQKVPDLTYKIICEEGRTPVIYVEILQNGEDYQMEDRSDMDTILMYGHLDKQPPFTGWNDGFGPYTPVLVDGHKLYGRGGADDGYAMFSSITAIANLKKQGVPMNRVVILIEACEESGSPDLPYYVQNLINTNILKNVSLVICLDSGAGDYKSMWMTTSLRGVLIANLKVSTLDEGVHSGDGSGVCVDSFRIIRQLISRLEDEHSGRMHESFHVDIPEGRINEVHDQIKFLGKSSWNHFPLIGDAQMDKNMSDFDYAVELALNRSWRPTLTVTGQEGLPPLDIAGNVLRPSTTVKLSIRLPPTLDPEVAKKRLVKILTSDPPHNAKVEISDIDAAPGWNAPILEDWLKSSIIKHSKDFFLGPPGAMGEGGSIPFMGMLGDLFPQAQFVVTGVLGPGANAHGPNEFIDLEYAQRLTCLVSHVVSDHFLRPQTINKNTTTTATSFNPESRVGGAAEDKLVSQKKNESI